MTTMPRSFPFGRIPRRSGGPDGPGRPVPRQLCQTGLYVACSAFENRVPVGREAPGPVAGREVDVEDLLQPGGEVRVLHRGEDLDAAVEVAGHHVRRSDVVPHRALPPVAEGEDPELRQV